MIKCYIGIDPGVTGCLCCLACDANGRLHVSFLELPVEGPTTILDWLLQSAAAEYGAAIAIEKVGGWMGGKNKKDGTKAKHDGQPAHQMFNFGKSYGMLLMAAYATASAATPIYNPTPRRWQKAIGASTTDRVAVKNGYQRHKRKLRDIAKAYFPNLADAMTLRTADATLLALYASLQESQNAGVQKSNQSAYRNECLEAAQRRAKATEDLPTMGSIFMDLQEDQTMGDFSGI